MGSLLQMMSARMQRQTPCSKGLPEVSSDQHRDVDLALYADAGPAENIGRSIHLFDGGYNFVLRVP